MSGQISRIGDLAAFRRDVTRRRATAVFDAAVLRATRRTIADVRRRRDTAVLTNVRRFDHAGARAGDLWIDARTLRSAARRCPPELRSALDRSYEAILAFHRKQRPTPIAHRGAAFREVLVPRPLARVGGCVPRGTVGYPSTALMIGVPARVAGVGDLVLVSPMPADGSVDPALAYAATKIGARGLYRAGGAAAVAALAYGTRTLERVDKIVGPGNAYTTAAKWLVSADVGIDALQGPSELVVIASKDADPAAIVLDLEAQAEHGGRPFAALLSDDEGILAVVRAVVSRLDRGDRAIGLYRVPSLAAAVEAAAFAAPEHLHLAGTRAARLVGRTRNAGAVFVGTRTAVAFGDYVAGSNHCLPTGGTARWASPLRVEDFVHWTTVVTAGPDVAAAARAGAAIAKHEGMDFHAASMELRG
jgi:histidinol dehydrogenase